MPLLEFNDKGIYCSRASVYIDPWKPVDKALITHGHSDHARYGHKHYMAVESAVPVIKYRLGSEISIQSQPFGKSVTINGVKFSFHPAGHIIGSAQVRVEYKGEVWVASGDYKTVSDGITEDFEVVPCNTFITESTFGLPVYRWKKQEDVFKEINDWWRQNKEMGKTSVLAGYALGKAQRILAGLDTSIGTIFTHGAIENVNGILRGQGIKLPETTLVTPELPKDSFTGNMVIATPSSLNSGWMRKFHPYSTGIGSGWMALRGARRRRSVDRGFILSDHADWDELNTTIKATGAERVYVTHGYTQIYSQWLESQGIEAIPVQTHFEGELGEIQESATNEEES